MCVRGSWRPNIPATFWPPTLMAVSFVSFSFSRAAQPAAQRLIPPGAGFLHRILSRTGLQTPSGVPRAPSVGCGFSYHILSPTSLIPNSSGAPRAPSAGLSLPHLISNFSGPQLSDFLSWPSYIIVQRPLNRPLNLWNGMFDRHKAEITVMQFTGHSVLGASVYECTMGFFLPCPISSAKSAHTISFDYWPLECVTSFRCITLEWHVCPGRRSTHSTSSRPNPYAKSRGLGKQACCLASSRVEKGHFSQMDPAVARANLSFSQRRLRFSRMRRPTSGQGFLGFSACF